MDHSAGVSTVAQVETRPPEVAALYPEAVDALSAYAQDLAEYGEALGLIGPRELGRLWTRHLFNCAVLTWGLGTHVASVADVGSGAGLPGLVLAIVRPQIEFVLVEPMERRATWLRQEAERLHLANVSVMRARAEEVVDQLNVDVVTARAVSALVDLLPKCVPLLHGRGELLLMKGQHAADELEKARKVVLLMDSSKLNKSLPYTFCSVDDLDCIVSDEELPADIREKAEKAGITVLTA